VAGALLRELFLLLPETGVNRHGWCKSGRRVCGASIVPLQPVAQRHAGHAEQPYAKPYRHIQNVRAPRTQAYTKKLQTSEIVCHPALCAATPATIHASAERAKA